jgi:hypothetical protein
MHWIFPECRVGIPTSYASCGSTVKSFARCSYPVKSPNTSFWHILLHTCNHLQLVPTWNCVFVTPDAFIASIYAYVWLCVLLSRHYYTCLHCLYMCICLAVCFTICCRRGYFCDVYSLKMAMEEGRNMYNIIILVPYFGNSLFIYTHTHICIYIYIYIYMAGIAQSV